jgi:hypothetical protein
MEKNTTKNYSGRMFSLVASLKYVLVVLELLLALRFLMKLMGAQVEVFFTKAVYFLTELFVLPFKNVLETYVFWEIEMELPAVLAGIVYWMATVALVKFLEFKKTTTGHE